ncbi:MAG: hypothetical protein E7323_11215 [Clostridiales bacterium]|nr:hypothetical protein [Clostridiales bacterium]
MYLADLHIHSRYSRATSRDLDPQHLDLWGRRKGLQLIGTGDLTHAAWREELRETLIPAGNGLYTLKEELRLPCETRDASPPLFVVTGEISTIYKKNGKTRKVHHVIILPGLDEADQLSHKLEAIGNIHSDGRPILGLDSHDLLEIVLETCTEAIYIPAHIWTPHFSLFGAFSGFDTVEECFGDLTPFVHAMETGLSSDPVMNRCLSMLDGYQLVSSSDAHSPAKLGREATILEGEPSYQQLKTAVETGEGLHGTIEFFPEEGKYHLDGHRNCHCRLEPEETAALGGRCPVCGRKITIGVLNRVRQLADRQQPVQAKPFESLIPLGEILAECMGVTTASKKVESAYLELLRRIGPEMFILRKAPPEQIEEAAGPVVAEAIRRLRAGKVHCVGGYDGEYGVIRVYEEGEAQAAGGQLSLLDALGLKPAAKEKRLTVAEMLKNQPSNGEKQPASEPVTQATQAAQEPIAPQLNEQQLAAVLSQAQTTAVIAGPGTGKTKTLVSRIEYLIAEKGVSPKEITAVTFTRQAAEEMQNRLETAMGKKAVRGLTVGTFHGIALGLLPKKTIADRETRLSLMADALADRGEKLSPAAALDRLSLQKNGKAASLPKAVTEDYQQRLENANLRDLDDVLLEALKLDTARMPCFRYLLVDEFQDINAVQHRLVRHWCGEDGNLFVIGDPDQSIYGFRGADADCFARLLADRPDTSVITLTQNYRSTAAVLECATELINRNPGENRCLAAQGAAGEPVRLMSAPDAFSEAAWIAREINMMVGGADMLSAHRPGNQREHLRAFSEMAVLCRTHRQLEQIETSLRHQGIPCVICGRERFWEDATVQALLGFFRWLRNPEDIVSLHTALHGLWKCPDALIQQAQAASRDVAAASENLLMQESMETFRVRLAPFELLAPFVDTVETLLPAMASQQPRKLIDQLAKLVNRKGKTIEQLLDAAVFHKRMDTFLNALETGEEADLRRRSGGEKASGAVSLMTLHGSKGLEFPVVFVAGINDGDLPHHKEGEETNVEEERRLLFVGITRAREELILSCGGVPSVFLKECPTSVFRSSIPQKQSVVRMEQLSLL